MNCTACIASLHDYVDGALSADDSRAFDAHIITCADCRSQLESLQALRQRTRELPRELAPARDLWAGIATQIVPATVASDHECDQREPERDPIIAAPEFRARRSRTPVLHWFLPLAVAASVAIVARYAERMLPLRSSLPGWSVAAVEGAPRVDEIAVRQEGLLRVGQWLVTDDSSRAKVTVGSIGNVNVEPNSRLRLVGVAATDHRLELARGTMSAFIYAPPRLFFVNTPSATAVTSHSRTAIASRSSAPA
jgi:anti-sigma factor RsiW